MPSKLKRANAQVFQQQPTEPKHPRLSSLYVARPIPHHPCGGALDVQPHQTAAFAWRSLETSAVVSHGNYNVVFQEEQQIPGYLCICEADAREYWASLSVDTSVACVEPLSTARCIWGSDLARVVEMALFSNASTEKRSLYIYKWAPNTLGRLGLLYRQSSSGYSFRDLFEPYAGISHGHTFSVTADKEFQASVNAAKRSLHRVTRVNKFLLDPALVKAVSRSVESGARPEPLQLSIPLSSVHMLAESPALALALQDTRFPWKLKQLILAFTVRYPRVEITHGEAAILRRKWWPG